MLRSCRRRCPGVASRIQYRSEELTWHRQVRTPGKKVQKTEAEWRELLSPEQFHVMRQKGTERAFTSPLNDNHKDGVYHCAACNAPLFKSDHKFESGSGWPSFWDPVTPDAIEAIEDKSHGMRRVEVVCANCGAHLGTSFRTGRNRPGSATASMARRWALRSRASNGGSRGRMNAPARRDLGWGVLFQGNGRA